MEETLDETSPIEFMLEIVDWKYSMIRWRLPNLKAMFYITFILVLRI